MMFQPLLNQSKGSWVLSSLKLLAEKSLSVLLPSYPDKQKLTMNDVVLFRRLQTARIKELELTNCGLNHEMLEELLKADLTNLTRLSLSIISPHVDSNKIGPIGCRMIASA